MFTRAKVVVFIDGDFWHGYRLPQWQNKLSPPWRKKIQDTRQRDLRNFRLLRRRGWHVLRIWEHQIAATPETCVDRVKRALEEASKDGPRE